MTDVSSSPSSFGNSGLRKQEQEQQSCYSLATRGGNKVRTNHRKRRKRPGYKYGRAVQEYHIRSSLRYYSHSLEIIIEEHHHQLLPEEDDDDDDFHNSSCSSSSSSSCDDDNEATTISSVSSSAASAAAILTGTDFWHSQRDMKRTTTIHTSLNGCGVKNLDDDNNNDDDDDVLRLRSEQKNRLRSERNLKYHQQRYLHRHQYQHQNATAALRFNEEKEEEHDDDEQMFI